MNAALLEEARKLSPAERLELIDALWDTLEPPGIDEGSVTVEEREVLDARMADLEANPSDESSWEEVKARLAMRRP